MRVEHKPVDGAAPLAAFGLLSLGSGTDNSLKPVGVFPTTLDSLLAGHASVAAVEPEGGEKKERGGEGEGEAPEAGAPDPGLLAGLAGLPLQLVVAAGAVSAVDAEGAAEGVDVTGSQPSLSHVGFARAGGGARGLPGTGVTQATVRAESGLASLGSAPSAPASPAIAAAGAMTPGDQENGGVRLPAERAAVFETAIAEQSGQSNTGARGLAGSTGGESVEPTTPRHQIRPGRFSHEASPQQGEVRSESTRPPTLEAARDVTGRENEAGNANAKTETDNKAAVSSSRLVADPARVAPSVRDAGAAPSSAAAAADGGTRSPGLLGSQRASDRGVDAPQTKSVLAGVQQLPTNGGDAEIPAGGSVGNPRGAAGGEARSLPAAEGDQQRVQVQNPTQPSAHGLGEVGGAANRSGNDKPGQEITTTSQVLGRHAGDTTRERTSEPPQTGAERGDGGRLNTSVHQTAPAKGLQTATVDAETQPQRGGTPQGQVAASRSEACVEPAATPEERTAVARVGARLDGNAEPGKQIEASRGEGHTKSGTAHAQQVAASRIEAHVDSGATPGRQLAASQMEGYIERAAWAERLADSLRVMSIRNGGEMRLALEPEGLGHIDVRVTLHHDGLRAVIVAEHDSTRALLNTQQHVLQAALERSSLRLAGFSIDLGLAGGGGGDFEDSGPWAGQLPAAGPHASVTDSQDTELTSVASPSYPGRLSVRV